jgi:hypothetical protein
VYQLTVEGYHHHVSKQSTQQRATHLEIEILGKEVHVETNPKGKEKHESRHIEVQSAKQARRQVPEEFHAQVPDFSEQ